MGFKNFLKFTFKEVVDNRYFGLFLGRMSYLLRLYGRNRQFFGVISKVDHASPSLTFEAKAGAADKQSGGVWHR